MGDSLNLNNVIAARSEYTNILKKYLVPLILEGLISLWDQSCILEKESGTSNYIMSFQKNLKEVPVWNSTIISQETERILEEEPLIMKMLTMILIAYIQILGSIKKRIKDQNSSIEIKIPPAEIFIHSVYHKSAYNIYNSKHILEIFHLYKEKEYNDIIRKAIETAIDDSIQQCIPIRELVDKYLDSVISPFLDDKRSQSHTGPVGFSSQSPYQSQSPSQDQSQGSYQDISQDLFSQGQGQSILPGPNEQLFDPFKTDTITAADFSAPTINVGNDKDIEQLDNFLLGTINKLEDTSDLFKDTSDLFKDTSDPFKDTSDPFKDTSDPFKDTSDPFKDTSAPFKDTSDPFKDTSDPFKDTTSDSIDTNSSDPFKNDPLNNFGTTNIESNSFVTGDIFNDTKVEQASDLEKTIKDSVDDIFNVSSSL